MKNRSPLFLVYSFVGLMLLTSCFDDVNNTGNDLITKYSLGGEKWVLTQYSISQNNPPFITHDTLVFSDSTHFTWQGIPSTYQYYYYQANLSTELLFNDSPFGLIRGYVPSSFNNFGELNGVKFGHPLVGAEQDYYLWLVKI